MTPALQELLDRFKKEIVELRERNKLMEAGTISIFRGPSSGMEDITDKAMFAEKASDRRTASACR